MWTVRASTFPLEEGQTVTWPNKCWSAFAQKQCSNYGVNWGAEEEQKAWKCSFQETGFSLRRRVTDWLASRPRHRLVLSCLAALLPTHPPIELTALVADIIILYRGESPLLVAHSFNLALSLCGLGLAVRGGVIIKLKVIIQLPIHRLRYNSSSSSSILFDGVNYSG